MKTRITWYAVLIYIMFFVQYTQAQAYNPQFIDNSQAQTLYQQYIGNSQAQTFYQQFADNSYADQTLASPVCSGLDKFDLIGTGFLSFFIGTMIGYNLNPAVPSSIWRKCLDLPTIADCNNEPDCVIENGTRCVPVNSQ